MSSLAEPVTRVIDAFAQLPGIGPKTASRLTYYLLRSDESIALSLANALQELKSGTLFCSVCHNIADRNPCPICDDTQRDHSVICVVEEPLDVQAIERTHEYRGVYHVLHGKISPMEGVGPDDLKIAELLHRIQAGSTDASDRTCACTGTAPGDESKSGRRGDGHVHRASGQAAWRSRHAPGPRAAHGR